MSAIDEILWLLKDGNWHDLTEIIKKITLSTAKAEIAVTFLCEYDFIQLNENAKKIKLQPSMLEFIEEIQRLENEELSH